VRTRVLIVGTDEWAIEQSAAALEAGGCTVLRCHEPGEPAFPCNALIEGRTCPLDAGFDVVATVRARALPTPAPAEFGVICALHAGAPLVVAGVGSDAPFGPWTSWAVSQGGDLVSACRAAAAERRARRSSARPGQPPASQTAGERATRQSAGGQPDPAQVPEAEAPGGAGAAAPTAPDPVERAPVPSGSGRGRKH